MAVRVCSKSSHLLHINGRQYIILQCWGHVNSLGAGAGVQAQAIQALLVIENIKTLLSVIPRLHDEAGSTSWLYERTTSARRALVEPARRASFIV